VTEFPSDAILIARGKYSTLAKERRTLMKGMQKDIEVLANNAHRILRAPEDLKLAQDEADRAAERLEAAQEKLDQLTALAPLLAALEPEAWGDGKEEF
jgi:hypothetical protein